MSKAETMKDIESFHKVVHKGKGGKMGAKLHQTEGKHASQNRFQVLEEEEEITKADQAKGRSLVDKENEIDGEQTQDISKQKETMMSDIELEMDQEMTRVRWRWRTTNYTRFLTKRT